MSAHRRAAAVLFTTLLLAPVSGSVAQDTRGGIPTETQERLRGGLDYNMIWNWIGLLGLVGLAGLHRGHDEDSYHPASFE